jgi:hypothetical protein
MSARKAINNNEYLVLFDLREGVSVLGPKLCGSNAAERIERRETSWSPYSDADCPLAFSGRGK